MKPINLTVRVVSNKKPKICTPVTETSTGYTYNEKRNQIERTMSGMIRYIEQLDYLVLKIKNCFTENPPPTPKCMKDTISN